MDIKSLFKNKNLIYLDKKFNSKEQLLDFFASELVDKGFSSDKQTVYNAFLARENQDSTGIGDKVAIPHMSDDVIKNSTLLFARVADLNWNSIDNQPVNFVFAIAFSKSERENSHLQTMANLSKLLINSEFVKQLNQVKTSDEFLELISKFQSTLKPEKNNDFNQVYDVVAVTSCPTGIAHTYLAEQKLLEQAQKMNVKIKVETQGADGTKNALTEAEIKNAKGVIIAVDREIERSKFALSDNVIEISTKKAIHNPQEQIQKILDKKGTKLNVSKSKNNLNEEEQSISFNGFGKRMYRSLMTGISFMLPFIVFGGIMIALAFIFDIIIESASGTDVQSAKFLQSFGSNSYVANIIKSIGDQAMGLAVPILAAYITFAIVGRQGLLPGFVVGAIASGKLSNSYQFLSPAISNANGSFDASGFLSTGSGFVGAIGGGFFAAFMIIIFSKYVFGNLPKTMQGIKNILFIPLIATLTIAIIFWAVNIILIFINLGLVLFLSLMQDNPYLAWLLGIILGLMMGFDLGGPVNKAAYIFGTLTLAQSPIHSSVSMAAVMAAGMVPPLGISLSMFINKKLWTKEEIEAGKISNIIFGLSFISEGAIPYTSKKPKILIPANMVGAAVAGLISAVLGVTIAAPHGGIFVAFLLKTNLVANFGASIAVGIIIWLAAILIGALTQAALIYVLTKIFAKKAVKTNK
ncbi:PTS fructose transporter subunit IIABC [Mesomycoplasma lagogenitalium]|uniref:Fructose-specific PTS transporter subunit EIIC n=1 Tax=Mesomycoplasma lagogenitalium TaxID=171286 RepID=A0ABY8LUI9_9BACT|nr:fructose-specific PTS transporter subunit EIIC [Mesomycoplasma lagogenitalium]WGI36902.1 fructose-specific PTS transporter subunit EIIC [Mesomycoplasma lagogenitalium]